MTIRVGRAGLIMFLIFCCFLPPAWGQTIINVGDTNPPQNMVLLIFDGMGSLYMTPGSIPHALDGTPILPAQVPGFEGIITEGMLIPDVKVPTPKTGPAHSVIITGYSKAEQEMVPYRDATIYDILDKQGFLSIAIMHKGDFVQLRNEQDIVLYSRNNTIKEPELELQVNNEHIPADIIDELEYWQGQLPGYLARGGDSYTAYLQWELDASSRMISFMAQTHPDTRYILTVNVGAVDSAGHYRGRDGYIQVIEAADALLGPLYGVAGETDTALVITADHGMAFKSSDSPRGGHASAEYYSQEAVTVPLIIVSPNVGPAVAKEPAGQEDVAPTLLSVLDIPVMPKYADGEVIPVKDYANLWVSAGSQADVEVFQGTELVSRGEGDASYIFTGLKPKNSYIVKVSKGDYLQTQTVDLDVDRLARFESPVKEEWELNRELVASVLILLVIIGGLLVIGRIKE